MSAGKSQPRSQSRSQLVLPPPNVLGMPDKFIAWRPHQDRAVEASLDVPSRAIAQVLPTGSGKSLIYITAAGLQGGRTIILTSTKALQSQLMQDFSSIGMVDIRGRNAYRCRAVVDQMVSCDDGPCTAGLHCGLRESGGCEYFEQVARAKAADLVVTNYAYWMAINRYAEGLGNFDTIVCDEGHSVPGAVESFIAVRLNRRNKLIKQILPREGLAQMSNTAWGIWAAEQLDHIEREQDRQKDTVKANPYSRKEQRKLRALNNVQRQLAELTRINDSWAVDVESSELQLVFSPMWPAPYCESALFLRIPHIVLTSAFICSKTTEMLGLKAADCRMREYPHSFPLENRRLTHIPTVRMNYRTGPAGLQLWCSRIDQIIKGRQDRKGIVHTTSYKRRDMLLANSKFRHLMLTHDSGNTEEIVQQFKKCDAPRVLVSPSITTGFDFPGDECRYQIIGKISYPDSRNKITKARQQADKEYSSYIAMQELVQACGRGVRAADDWAETFIIDDNAVWFLRKYAHFAPRWFIESYRSMIAIPQAPEISKRRN